MGFSALALPWVPSGVLTSVATAQCSFSEATCEASTAATRLATASTNVTVSVAHAAKNSSQKQGTFLRGAPCSGSAREAWVDIVNSMVDIVNLSEDRYVTRNAAESAGAREAWIETGAGRLVPVEPAPRVAAAINSLSRIILFVEEPARSSQLQACSSCGRPGTRCLAPSSPGPCCLRGSSGATAAAWPKDCSLPHLWTSSPPTSSST